MLLRDVPYLLSVGLLLLIAEANAQNPVISVTKLIGDKYFSIGCSVSTTTEPGPTFEWVFGESSSLPSGITTSSDTKTLMSSSLQTSHTGLYKCRLQSREMSMINLTVIDPTANIIGPSRTLMLDTEYTLTCSVTGNEGLNPAASTMFLWKRNGVSFRSGSSTLEHTYVQLSEAGNYECEVTITSGCSNKKISTAFPIIIQIPPPRSVQLTNSTVWPKQPVTLTCRVKLISAVDIAVIVKTKFTDPNGDMINTHDQSVGRIRSSSEATYTIDSFSRANSGLYKCSATITSTSRYLDESSALESNPHRVTTGVYLMLGDDILEHDANVSIFKVGQSSDGALQCITDKNPCCDSPKVGKWLLPSGTEVPESKTDQIFYTTRGSSGEVQLNRPNGVLIPLGKFCCQVPDFDNSNTRRCVNIFNPNIKAIISESGPPTVGRQYTLTCTVKGDEALNPIRTYKWTKTNSTGQNTQVGANRNTLQLNNLRLHDAAMYMCTVNISSIFLTREMPIIITDTHTTRVSIPAPPVVIMKMKIPQAVCFAGSNNLKAIASRIILKCNVMSYSVSLMDTELSLIRMDVKLTRNGDPLVNVDLMENGFVYTTRLNAFGLPGKYACNAIVKPLSSSEYLLENSTLSNAISIEAGAPPVNVEATQSSSSAPVEVSWSTPSDSPINITAYSIYFGQGHRNNITVANYVTGVSFPVTDDYSGHTLSIYSETDQLPSELINVTITKESAAASRALANQVGISVGVTVPLSLLLGTVVISTLIFFYFKRKKPSEEKGGK